MKLAKRDSIVRDFYLFRELLSQETDFIFIFCKVLLDEDSCHSFVSLLLRPSDALK